MKAVLDRLILEIDPPDNVTESGIYIPTAGVTRQNMATVIAVGPGIYNSAGVRTPPPVSVGDRVVLPEGVTQSFTIDEKEYHVTQYSNILGIISE